MRLVLVAFVASLAAACSSPTTIHIDPLQPVLRTKADRIQLVAHVMSGNLENARAQVAWSSADPTIATVDETGHVAGLKSGRTTISAKDGQVTASVPVEVSFVESLQTNMGAVTVSYKAGDPIQPKIQPLGYDGRVLKGRSLYWKSKDDKICRVDPSGQIWPVELGETDVVASIDDKSVTIHCTVDK